MRILDKYINLENKLGRRLHEGLEETEQGGVSILVHHQGVVLDTRLYIMRYQAKLWYRRSRSFAGWDNKF